MRLTTRGWVATYAALALALIGLMLIADAVWLQPNAPLDQEF